MNREIIWAVLLALVGFGFCILAIRELKRFFHSAIVEKVEVHLKSSIGGPVREIEAETRKILSDFQGDYAQARNKFSLTLQSLGSEKAYLEDLIKRAEAVIWPPVAAPPASPAHPAQPAANSPVSQPQAGAEIHPPPVFSGAQLPSAGVGAPAPQANPAGPDPNIKAATP